MVCNTIRSKMTSQIWLVVFLFFFKITNILSVPKSYYTRGATWPYDLATPFPYRTNAPLNIVSSKVKKLPPITNVIATEERVTVENNGNTVVIRLNQASTLSSLSGGPFFMQKYSFVLIYFYWSNDYRKAVAEGVDGGAGPQLLAIIVFYNTKYGSLEKAVRYRDGLGIVALPIYVQGHIPNPSFTPFQAMLEQVKHPGPVIHTLCGLVAAYFNYGSISYYTYPGNYTMAGKDYDSATWIIPRANRTFISVDQFKVFVSLRNNRGSPIDATIDSFPQKPYIPVVQGKFLAQIII